MRVKWTVACAGLLLFAAIAFPLMARVPNVTDVPLSPGYEQSLLTFVRILPEAGVSSAGPGRTHRAQLMVKDPGRVLRHRQVGLLVGTVGTSPDLESAELAFVGTRCVYKSDAGAKFPNNRTLDLYRSDGCAPLEGTPTGKITLTVTLRNRARMVLWTHIVATATLANDTVSVDPSPEPIHGETLAPSGRLVDDGAPSDRRRRVELLAYLWQVRPGSMWILGVVAFGALVISIGFLGLCARSTGPNRLAAVRGFSAFLLTIGLGVLYAVLTPPFQAPDEPHHFVAFAELVGRPELVSEADAWAALGHVDRIRFRPAERFTAADVGKPGPVWERPSAPDSSIRGGGVHVLWKAVAPLLRSMSAPGVFLSLRLCNVLLVAAAVGLFVGVVVRSGQVPSPHLLAFSVLLVPTLPFFGMHISNHAPVIAAYVILTGGLVLMVLNRSSDRISGLIVGIGWTAAIALSRSAMPLAPLIAAIAATRLLFGPSGAKMISRIIFWGGMIVPALVLLSMSGSAAYVAANTRLGAGALPGALRAAQDTVAAWPWLLGLAIPLLAVTEWALGQLRSRVGREVRSATARISRYSALAAAALVVSVLIGSMFVSFPELATIDPLSRPPAMTYVRDALWAALTMLRFGEPDYRTSVTFWGGFGWLETLPSSWFISLLTGATGIALVGLLMNVARTRDTRRALFLAATAVGFAATVASYAVSLTQLQVAIDFAGRYVFGLYLATVVICWSGLAFTPAGPGRERLQSSVMLGCVLACTGVHAYCLRLILYRYF